jgi:hypothetical protein
MKQPKKVSSERQIVVRPGEPFIRGRTSERREVIDGTASTTPGTEANTVRRALDTAHQNTPGSSKESKAILSAYEEYMAKEGRRRIDERDKRNREAKAKK